MRTRALLIVLTTLILAPLASANEPKIEYGGFKTLFMDQVGGAIESQINAANEELARADIPEGRRLELEAELAELRALERQVGDVAMVESLYGSITGGFDAIRDLAKEIETGYDGDSSINAAIIALNDLGGTNRLRQLSAASSGLDAGLNYFNQIRQLQSDLADLDATELSPSTRRLASQLTVMTSIMSNFGDKVPLIGDFIKAYGDVGGGLLQATVALDNRIREMEQGELRDGVHGLERGEMLRKLQALGPTGASAIGGLRDAYKTDCNRFVLWDRRSREWLLVQERDIDEKELRRRYLFFAQQGVANPTPEQIVTAFARALILELTPSETHIKPGDSVTLTASARRASDDRPVTSAHVRVKLATHTGWRKGTFDGPTEVRVGTPVRWTSPESENRSFTFVAELISEDGSWNAAQDASAGVLTGAETRMNLTGEPLRVRPGEAVALEARIVTTDGAAVDSGTSGLITFSEASGAGYFTGYAATGGGKGLERTWVAPSRPGPYVITAVYEGGTSFGRSRRHFAGSEASINVEVRPPAWSMDVSPASAEATRESPAEFRVRLRNDDEEAQSFGLAGGTSPASERAFWSTRSNMQRSVEVPGRGERVIEVVMTPTNDRASRLRGEIRARTKGCHEVRSVSMLASATRTERKVTISARGEHSRPLAGGQRSYSSTVAPGAEISLSFQPWGPQREFCVTEVIERNRNMRQVMVSSHGPNGCSWGTVDGRMSAAWRVDSENVTWSGAGVRAPAGSTTATFVVPDEPGTYTVTARGETTWSYTRRAPGGTARDSATDRSNATYTIVVE